MKLAGAVLVALSLNSPALARQEASAFQIRAKEIVLADGVRSTGGLLVVEGGRIARVLGSGAEPDPALPLIEHDGVLPGQDVNDEFTTEVSTQHAIELNSHL